MVKILGLDSDGKWHECRQILSAARMERECDSVVVRAVAWARSDSPVILFKDVCPKCADKLLPFPARPA